MIRVEVRGGASTDAERKVVGDILLEGENVPWGNWSAVQPRPDGGPWNWQIHRYGERIAFGTAGNIEALHRAVAAAAEVRIFTEE